MVLPSGRTSRVKSIVTWDGDLQEAFAPMSVTVCLEDEIDISRGDMLVHAGNPPHFGRRFEATVVWMNQKPLEPNHPYLLKHTTQTGQARVREIRYRIDVNTLEHQPVSELAAQRNRRGQRGGAAPAVLRSLREEPLHRQLHPDRPDLPTRLWPRA